MLRSCADVAAAHDLCFIILKHNSAMKRETMQLLRKPSEKVVFQHVQVKLSVQEVSTEYRLKILKHS